VIEHTLTASDLARFTGTEYWYQHPLVPTVAYTDGAKFVATEGGAYWLLDIIALAQRYEKAVIAEPFQAWKLTVQKERTATLICEDGNGKQVYWQHLDYTDFPLAEIILYVTDQVILLPGEY
jgi:hypothetical protein